MDFVNAVFSGFSVRLPSQKPQTEPVAAAFDSSNVHALSLERNLTLNSIHVLLIWLHFLSYKIILSGLHGVAI